MKGRFDVVFSSASLNNLPPKLRLPRFAHFKAATAPRGVHAVNAFVAMPRLAPPPDMDPHQSPYLSGELQGYYRDWDIIEAREFVFECSFSGIPHQHALDVVIARRPS